MKKAYIVMSMVGAIALTGCASEQDEYEVKENHMNEKIAEIQDVMEIEKRRSDEQLKEMKAEIILTLKQNVVEVSGIV